MAKAQKKVCLLVASSLPGLDSDQIENWINHMPELKIIADIEPVFVLSKPSVNVAAATWVSLAQQIKKGYSRYDGFVILHGVTGLLFTGSALSFMLGNLNKPVVITGSQSADELAARHAKNTYGVKANVINAVQVAVSDLSEVAVMFGNRLLRVNQSTAANDESLNVFNAPDSAVLGRIDFSIRIFDKKVKKAASKLSVAEKLETNIEVVYLEPLVDISGIAARVPNRSAILVNAGAAPALPEDLSFIFEKIGSTVPVVVWSTTITELPYAPKNLLLVNAMTWPATMTKLMWALPQATTIDQLKKIMARSVAKELL